MIQRILVPLDGSPLAEQGLAPACRLAQEAAATLVLVRASTGHTPLVLAQAYLEAVQQLLAAQRYAVQIDVQPGDPVQGILTAALTQCADIICLCTHGYTGLSRLALGSVAEAVVRRTALPVLLVRGTDQPGHAGASPFGTILVPLDGTVLAERTLTYLVHTPVGHAGQLILLRAIPETAPVALPILAGRTATQIYDQTSGERERLHAEAESYLTSVGYACFSRRAWRSVVVTGDAAREILATAHSEAVDLIVLATHGRRGIDRLLHAGVAHAVLHQTLVPVLLL
jgi:nucleotide-binding universal stress UspA family protein